MVVVTAVVVRLVQLLMPMWRLHLTTFLLFIVLLVMVARATCKARGWVATGSWCSGITSAPHAEGPGFKSQWVHILRESIPQISSRSPGAAFYASPATLLFPTLQWQLVMRVMLIENCVAVASANCLCGRCRCFWRVLCERSKDHVACGLGGNSFRIV